MAIGNYVGQFIESDVKNFDGTSRNYVRIRVFIDIRSKLKQDIRLKKARGEWFTVPFQYERLPTFCFYCGLIGHSELKCEKLFDTFRNRSEFEYGPDLHANFRRTINSDGACYLRQGMPSSTSTTATANTNMEIEDVNHGTSFAI